MNKTENQPENDIATEPYKGPGTLVTGAGEGALAHYGTGFAGLITGAVGAYFAPKKVEWVEAKFKSFSEGGSNIFRKIAGGIVNISRDAATHFPGSKSVLKHVPANRLQAVIFGGGLLGVFGFFVAPLYFFITGTKHSNAGRDQFRTAQDEIITTRAERDALRDKYADTKIELESLKSGRGLRDEGDDSLAVAKDNPPKIETPKDTTTAALSQADSPTEPTAPEIRPARTTGRTLETVQADSPTTPSEPPIGPAPTTGRTLPGPGPRIQEPTIGPDQAEGWAARESVARDAAEGASYPDIAR